MNMAGLKRVFCDTSFFYAALDPKDVNHGTARELATWAAENTIEYFTTWDIVSETATLLLNRASYRTTASFLNKIKPTLGIVTYDETIRNQAERIFIEFAKDKFLSYCDAISFVVVTILLDNIPCLSFDRDFISLGLTVLRSPT